MKYDTQKCHLQPEHAKAFKALGSARQTKCVVYYSNKKFYLAGNYLSSARSFALAELSLLITKQK